MTARTWRDVGARGGPRGVTLENFFRGRPESRVLHDAVAAEVAELGDHQVRVTRSQVAFVHGVAFAFTWIPARYLHGQVAPLVLSLPSRTRMRSARFKEVVEPAPGRFMHHLELREVADVDGEVRAWLRACRDEAGRARGA